MIIQLKTIALDKRRLPKAAPFPFNLSFVRTFKKISLTSPITFLVGENGSGKSTFLEALAVAVGSPTIGTESLQTDRTLAHVKGLAKCLKLS